MTEVNAKFKVNADGAISEDVCNEIVSSIRVVPNFPKPVGAHPIALSPWLLNQATHHCAVLTGSIIFFCLPLCPFFQNLLFKDLSLLLANPKAYGGVIDALVAKYAKRDVTAVVGIGLPP